MMQQVATKRSDVAALPIDIEVTQAKSGAGSQFNEALTQAGEAVIRGKEGKGKTTPIRPVPDSVSKPPTTEQRYDVAAEPGVRNAAEKTSKVNETKAVKEPASATEAQAVDTEIQGEQTDWLALVESIKDFNEGGDSGDLQKAIGNFIDAEQEIDSELVFNFEQLMEQISLDEGKENNALTKMMESLLDKVMAEDESGNAPQAAASQDAVAMAAALLAAIGLNPEGDSEKAAKALEDALAALRGLSAGIIGSSDKGGSEDPLKALSAESAEADATLLLNVLRAELAGKGEGGKTGEKGELLNPAELAKAVKNSDALSASMQQLSEESKQQVGEALAEKVVALLPTEASEQQQQSVKSAVIAGVKEIQSQLAQGREPAINLQDLIANAVSEADLTLTQQMKAGIEQQLSQLNMVVQATQHTLAHAQEVTHLVSTDTAIQENMQLRSEASKAQQAADGVEKPVNILKADGQQQLSEKIRWMVNARNSFAEIRLDPPEMGSMQVRVNVSGDTATVSFIVQSAQAKEALADAAPRLRDMLAEQGIELGESFVQQDNRQGEGSNPDGELAGRHGDGPGAEDEELAVVEQKLSRQALGGIDDYA